MKRALVSVYEKRGVESFVHGLLKEGWEVYSTGGTFSFLKGEGLNVKKLDKLTGFTELLGGRVKTLHPSVFAGILARRDVDKEEMEKLGLPLFDLVAVNLYPFGSGLLKGESEDELIEKIDIGGVALVRAAAKNFKWVTVVIHPDDYLPVLEEIQKYGDTTEQTRRKLAAKAFSITSFYDAMIFSRFNEELFPFHINFPFTLYEKLRYGENPHQMGAFYVTPTSIWKEVEVLQGKKLSFNNIADISSAWELAMDFHEPFCAIIKHQNPCGAAIAETPKKAFINALSGDPQSAFGGIVVFNMEVDEETALEMKKMFLEVIVAPGFTKGSREVLSKKKNLRLVILPFERKDRYEGKLFEGALLLQERDAFTDEDMEINWVSKPADKRKEDIYLGIRLAKALKSNSAVIVKDKKMIAGCGGQTSRVEAVRIACERAGEEAKGAVLVSDGFFPFPDSVEIAHFHGIEVVVAPGGSKRDPEVSERAKELGLSFGFTARRHFRH